MKHGILLNLKKIIIFSLGFMLIIVFNHTRSYAEEYKAFPLSSALWLSNNIPVCWENISGWEQQASWVRNAIAGTWEAESIIVFSGWNNCTSSSKGIRIRIDDSGPHTKGLGRQLDGTKDGMVLNFKFNNWCQQCSNNIKFSIEAIAIHEFGHALGFAHEQNRPDTPSWCEQRQGGDGDLLLGNWDQDSVMNYCSTWWNNNGKLSVNDIQAVRLLYGGPEQKNTRLVYAVQNNRLHAVFGNGTWLVLGPAAWGGATSMTSLGERLYIIQNNRLHEVNPSAGTWKVLGRPAWEGPTRMTSLHDSLYVIQNKRLHKVDPSNGNWKVLGEPAWEGSTSMTSLDGSLFVIQNQRLHKVNPDSGQWQVLGTPAWGGNTHMAAYDSSLYIIQNDKLHKVDQLTGKWEVLGDAAWKGATSMTTINGKLYIIQNDRFHEVNPKTGTWQVLGPPAWGGSTQMAAIIAK